MGEQPEATPPPEDILILTFDYDQKARDNEIGCALRQSQAVDFQHCVMKIPNEVFVGSALNDSEVGVERGSSWEPDVELPSQLRGKNVVFLGLGVALAMQEGHDRVIVGTDCESPYADDRASFLSKYNLALKAMSDPPVGIEFPLLHHDKHDIILKAHSLNLDFAKTSTCMDPFNGKACGVCRACTARLEAFTGAGLRDPLKYARVRPGFEGVASV
jgi:7-cyano-7-deazaguanine synthase